MLEKEVKTIVSLVRTLFILKILDQHLKSVNKAIASISKCFYQKDISFVFFICLLNKENKISAFQKRICQTKIQSRNQFGMISHILSSMARKKLPNSFKNLKDSAFPRCSSFDGYTHAKRI